MLFHVVKHASVQSRAPTVQYQTRHLPRVMSLGRVYWGGEMWREIKKYFVAEKFITCVLIVLSIEFTLYIVSVAFGILI